MVKLDNPDIQQAQDVTEGGVKPETNTGASEERRREVIDLPEDGKYGGELAGRLVWEAYEAGLKVWERENPRPAEKEGAGDGKEKEKEKSGSMDIRTHIPRGQNR